MKVKKKKKKKEENNTSESVKMTCIHKYKHKDGLRVAITVDEMT
jgi:hypothetical protein